MCPLIKWIMWQHHKMCTNNICWFQVCSVVRMLLCLRDFCPFYLSFSFVMLAPVAATHTGMPLLPTSVNGTGGEFKSKHIYMCCLACWLPEQLLLHCNRSSPAQVGSWTSSLFFFPKLTSVVQPWQSGQQCNQWLVFKDNHQNKKQFYPSQCAVLYQPSRQIKACN